MVYMAGGASHSGLSADADSDSPTYDSPTDLTIIWLALWTAWDIYIILPFSWKISSRLDKLPVNFKGSFANLGLTFLAK